MSDTIALPADTSPLARFKEQKSASKGKKPEAKVTHASAVRMALESDIFTGRLPPGSPVDEEAVAERFQVSRTPVREAMLQLIQTGLIEKRSRQRATVARLDLHRLIHMFETISELEGVCARLAARRITLSEKDELIRVQEQSQAALLANKQDEYARLGRRFHALVIQATHNNVLIETTDKLALQTVPYRRFQLRRNGRPEANQADHQRILDAIVAGNEAEAGDLMRRHVTVQGDVLAEYISMGEAQALV